MSPALSSAIGAWYRREMAGHHDDARDLVGALRAAALGPGGVVEGGSCTKAAFAAGGKNFLFVGEEGGVVRVMVKLRASLAEAEAMAAREPERYKVGSTGWVTGTFAAGAGAPVAVLMRWISESRAVLVPTTAAKKVARATGRASTRG